MKTLKSIVLLCIALFAISAIGQSKNQITDATYTKQTVTNFKIEINVNSLKALERSFNIEDMQAVFSNIVSKDEIEFKINCTKSLDNKLGVTQKIAYKITGNLEEKAAFLKMAEKIYKAAKKYYDN